MTNNIFKIKEKLIKMKDNILLIGDSVRRYGLTLTPVYEYSKHWDTTDEGGECNISFIGYIYRNIYYTSHICDKTIALGVKSQCYLYELRTKLVKKLERFLVQMLHKEFEKTPEKDLSPEERDEIRKEFLLGVRAQDYELSNIKKTAREFIVSAVYDIAENPDSDFLDQEKPYEFLYYIKDTKNRMEPQIQCIWKEVAEIISREKARRSYLQLLSEESELTSRKEVTIQTLLRDLGRKGGVAAVEATFDFGYEEITVELQPKFCFCIGSEGEKFICGNAAKTRAFTRTYTQPFVMGCVWERNFNSFIPYLKKITLGKKVLYEDNFRKDELPNYRSQLENQLATMLHKQLWHIGYRDNKKALTFIKVYKTCFDREILSQINFFELIGDYKFDLEITKELVSIGCGLPKEPLSVKYCSGEEKKVKDYLNSLIVQAKKGA